MGTPSVTTAVTFNAASDDFSGPRSTGQPGRPPRYQLHGASYALLTAEQERFNFPNFQMGPVTTVAMSSTEDTRG